ncbi:MAG: PCRF domain-containing protein, partial [bacterium]
MCWPCGTVFDVLKKEKEIAELETKTAAANFWNDREKAQAVMRDISQRREWVEAWRKLEHTREDVAVMLELAEEGKDEALFAEAETGLLGLTQRVDELELRSMLSGEHDECDAILTIHPGAGGTESQDWAQMLFRMYMRWIERSGYACDVIDLQAGDEAGLKDAAIEVRGKYAYGYLRAESGVHRLVRISP